METDTIKSRRKYQGAKNNSVITMKRLIDAVGEIIKSDGITNLRVSRIAQQAGLDKKLIYYHFGDKAHLINAYLTSYRKAKFTDFIKH